MRLVTFGDSWTAGHGVEDDIRYKEVANPEYFTQQLRLANGWPRFLSDKYSIPFVNLGIPGIDNLDILNIIKDSVGSLRNTDIVIVMLSYPYRHLKRVNLPLGNLLMDMVETLSPFNYYIFNSFYPTFTDEPYLKSEIDMRRFIKMDETPLDILVEYEKSNDISVWEYNSRYIYNDTQAAITGEYHPNLLGYRIIADWVFKQLPI
jgi:hypothetical protein